MRTRVLARVARCCRHDRGAAALELAILWSVIVMLLFGAIQVATYFEARTVALQAAQLGVSAARQYDGTEQAGEDRAAAFLNQTGDWLVDYQLDGPHRDLDTGAVTMTVSGDALTLVPFLTWEIEQTAHGTIERFTCDPGPCPGSTP